MKAGANQSLSALDDGFAKVCDAVNDVSFIVRTQAAKLLVKRIIVYYCVLLCIIVYYCVLCIIVYYCEQLVMQNEHVIM